MNKELALRTASTVPGHYHPASLDMLYDHAIKVPPDGIIVEIGVLYGRSATVLLGAVEETGAMVVLIDNWIGHHEHCMNEIGNLMLRFHNLNFQILHMSSRVAAKWTPCGVDLLHVDGNHQSEGIDEDCRLFLPLLKAGGVACFHDYGVSMFPGIKERVDHYTYNWAELGGADVAIFRRKP